MERSALPPGERILLTGATGQVGWELLETLGPLGELVAPTRAEIDLTSNRAGRLTRLCFFCDFFLGSRESSPLVSGKTLQTFAGNLIEDRINFFGDKLRGSHRSKASSSGGFFLRRVR